jgi:hypothetical protein
MIPCPLGTYCSKDMLDISIDLYVPYNYRLIPEKGNHTCGVTYLLGDVGNIKEIFCSTYFYCPIIAQIYLVVMYIIADWALLKRKYVIY